MTDNSQEMSHDPEILLILTSHPDFARVSESGLTALIAAGAISEMTFGSVLIRQGDPGRGIWILIDGTLEILVDGDLVNRIDRAGEVIGQISAVSLLHATATVRTAEPTRCLYVPHEALHRLLARHSELAQAILRSMVKYHGRR